MALIEGPCPLVGLNSLSIPNGFNGGKGETECFRTSKLNL